MTQDIDVGKLAEQINDKADRDLRNTVPNVWNNTLNTSQITNCITEIPQDIKLELKDGVLTLKAGSKIYIPNGFEADGTTKKFDEVVIESDLTYGGSSINFSATKLLIRKPDGTLFINNGDYVSGSSYTGSTYGIWYDTTNNKIKYTTDGGSTWIENYSLPVAQITITSGTGVSSIDQIFNGFGYIGSTVFALPGVKGLIPNGRNEDGSLKNIEFTTSMVLTQTTNTAFTDKPFSVSKNGVQWINYLGEFTTPPAVQQYKCYYNPIENKLYFAYTSDSWEQFIRAFCGRVSSNGKITSFTPKTTFHALDYNDKAEISGLGMPSNRYIDLTLGASGASYIAPANGWFWLSKKSSAANQYMNIGNNISGYVQNYSSGASDVMNLMRPARKGETVFIYYNVAGSTNYFKFVYAEGEN